MAKAQEPKAGTLWTAQEVAAYLHASRAWVYREAKAGHLPCRNVLGLLRFDPEQIVKLNEDQKPR